MNRLLLLLAIFFVSTAGLFAHRALAEATPLAISAWRLGLASLFFAVLSLFNPHRKTQSLLTAPTRLRLLLAGFCLAAHFLTWFGALDYTPVARATLLACTTPLWTTLGGFLLGRRRPTGRDLAALAIASIGLLLVTHAAVQIPSPKTFLGDCLGLAAGLLFGVYLLCVEGLHETISSQRQVTITYSAAAILLWACLLVQGGIKISYSSGVWGALLGMTLGPQIFGHTLINWSLRHFPSSQIAFAILLEPILAAGLAWVLLHEAVTPLQMLGGLLVLIAIAVVIGQQTPMEHVEDEPVG